MTRSYRLFVALTVLGLSTQAPAQDEGGSGGIPAVDFDSYLAAKAQELNAGDELPDLNLGGYRGSAWGRAGTSDLAKSSESVLLGASARRSAALDGRGAVVKVNWYGLNKSGEASTLLELLKDRYGEPSSYRVGRVEEARWIGASSTLVFQRAGGEWLLTLSPTKRR